MEPLQLIREAAMSKAAVNCADGFYSFGGKKFDVNTKTAFKRTHQRASYYTMRDIIFFLEHVNTPMAEYRRLAYKAGTVAIVQADTEDLKKYLTGVVDDCSQIDHSMPAKKPSAPAPSVEALEDLSAEKLETLNRFRKRRRLEPNISADTPLETEFLALDKIQLAKLRSDEYPANTRASMLHGTSDTDFGFVLKLFSENVLKPEQLQVQHAEKSVNPSSSKTPIIIVPNSTASCLSMLNACDFLRDGIFISTEEKRKSGATRESFMLFQHTDTTTGKVKVFKLMDNPTTLSSEDWHRVVAVFVSGQTWQFKGWKWSSPVELFKNVMGIYLTFDDRPIDNNVLSWNCKTIKIKQFERHQDAGASMSFWKMLDNYLHVRRPS